MNFKQEAARLTEKIYSIKGSNQANEVQALLRDTLEEFYKRGYDKGYDDVTEAIEDYDKNESIREVQGYAEEE